MIETPITAASPSVSVVIPSLPENDHSDVIDCLRNQSADGFEVFVVNDDTLDICEARNEGIEAAGGDIVALTDDDCRPPTYWVEIIQSYFGQHPETVCLEGRVSGGREYAGERKYVGCNLAFRREVALEAGGFRSTYAGWRDDTEFGWRMEDYGRCAYVDEVVMEHPDLPRSDIINSVEVALKSEYPERYEEIVVPSSFTGKINDWLWRKGVWDLVDRVRYGGGTA